MIRISFTGDVSFTGAFANPGWTTFSVAPALVEFLRASEHVVVNLEGPLTSLEPARVGRSVRLTSPPNRVATLKDLGCTVLNLANNHILDSGRQGLEDTTALARGKGLKYQGAGRNLPEACAPLVLSAGGISAALLAFTVDIGQQATQTGEGTCSGFSGAVQREMIHKAKALADRVIVQYHGGDEFVELPSKRQIRLLRGLVDSGADVVICHHAHVVQPYERYNEGLIFYGLGNFIFDIPAHRGFPGTTDSVLVRLSLTRGEVAFDCLGTRIDRAAGRIESLGEQGAVPPLDLTGYRFRYGRAVYDACYWPGVPRDATGAPDIGRLRAQREPLWRRLLSPGRWRRYWNAFRDPRRRAQMVAMAEYRVRSLLSRQDRFDRESVN